MRSYHSPFLLENHGKQSNLAPVLLFRRTTMLIFKTAPKNGKSTSMGSMCSPWGQDTTQGCDWERTPMVVCCWWTCCWQVGEHVEQRRSEQPIEDQLSNINPQQPNSCHHQPPPPNPSRCTSDHHHLTAAPPFPPTSMHARARLVGSVAAQTGIKCVNPGGEGSCCRGFLGVWCHKQSPLVHTTVIWHHFIYPSLCQRVLSNCFFLCHKGE